MTLGLGNILKEDTTTTNHKGKVENFPTLKGKTSGIPPEESEKAS